jgi:hypothetical protein
VRLPCILDFQHWQWPRKHYFCGLRWDCQPSIIFVAITGT